MKYDMGGRSLRNLWKKFFSVPYVTLNELYKGVTPARPAEAGTPTARTPTAAEAAPAEDEGPPKKQLPMGTGDDGEEMYKTFMQFVGTEMITLESLEKLLQDMGITLPDAVVQPIFQSCDEPVPGTRFAVIKR